MSKSFDIIVVGSGPGGYVAAIRAAQLGSRVAIIEREALGGICLNWGCIPTKALLKSAKIYTDINAAHTYGIALDKKKPKADFPAIIGRSRQVATNMSKGIQFLMKKNNITTIQGNASLLSAKEVEVSDKKNAKKTYSASNIILAVGASAKSLPVLPIDKKYIIGYREAMSLKTLPKHLLVVGSGAIGMEFAYFYHALGTKVTVIESMDTILPREDKDVSVSAQKYFSRAGITFHTQVLLEKASVDTRKGQVKLTLQDAQKKSFHLTADKATFCGGHRSQYKRLGTGSFGRVLDARCGAGRPLLSNDLRRNLCHRRYDCPTTCPGARSLS